MNHAISYNYLTTDLNIVKPNIKAIIKNTKNMKNSNLAMPADAAATPVNPNKPETIAIIKNMNAHFNIYIPLFISVLTLFK